MPTLRFTRDKRGYETTSLVHAGRRNGRSRQRILYWFRTPPGVKVGRPALDEDAIRWIEERETENQAAGRRPVAADRLALLTGGKIVQQGTQEEFLKSNNPKVQEFLERDFPDATFAA